MDSRGSVIPLFMEQVKAGRPLAVTDPTMTRFVMPFAEYLGLVDPAHPDTDRECVA
jgi:UDP-N-acetylglucosamine 4,6-dehydratase